MATGGIELPIATAPADMARPTDPDGWTSYLHRRVLPAIDQGPDLLPSPGGRQRSCGHDCIIGYPDHDVQSTAYHLTGFSVPDHRLPELAEHALMTECPGMKCHDARMRTTLPIDAAIARALKDLAHREGKPFEQVVNETLRAGLRAPAPRKSRRYKRSRRRSEGCGPASPR